MYLCLFICIWVEFFFVYSVCMCVVRVCMCICVCGSSFFSIVVYIFVCILMCVFLIIFRPILLNSEKLQSRFWFLFMGVLLEMSYLTWVFYLFYCLIFFALLIFYTEAVKKLVVTLQNRAAIISCFDRMCVVCLT